MSDGSIAAAIIAGGQARRFNGCDKSRLLVEGRPIIVRQIEILHTVADEIFIVANRPERYTDLDLPVVTDRVPDVGAIGGIYTAIATAAAPVVLTIACDLPFIDGSLLRRLAELSVGVDGAWVRTSRGVEPLLACYRTTSRVPVEQQINRGRLKAADLGEVLRMAEIGPDALAHFGPAERLLANVNTPADYARVQYGRS